MPLDAPLTQTQAARVSAPVPIDGDAALDTSAAYLRALARSAGDVHVAARLEAWAQHLLVLTPAPGQRGVPADRDWGGARRAGVEFVTSTAAETKRHVDELGGVIWSLVEGTARIISDGNALDGETSEVLGRLKEAVGLAPDELKAAAVEAVTNLTEILDKRVAQTATLDTALVAKIDQLTNELTRAKRDAELDPLTEVSSRRAIENEVGRAISIVALAEGDPVSVLLVDLDGFKNINDTHGHQAGDAALKHVAEAMTRTFPRSSDMVARYGGDEFVVLLRYAAFEDAVRLGKRFLDMLDEHPLSLPSAAIRLRASVGVTSLRRRDTVSAVIERADLAMYEAKRAGGNRVMAVGESGDVLSDRLERVS
jgi:diguanylate cyclase (GGDEF)-like protein